MTCLRSSAGFASDSRELQDLCCDALERLPAGRHAAELIGVLGGSEVDDWPTARRRRLLTLMIRWGGKEADEFVVKRLSARNPFRRARIEEQRAETLEWCGAWAGAAPSSS